MTHVTMPLRRWVGGVVVVLLASVTAAYVLDSLVRVVLWRSHWQPGLDALRRYNKRFTGASALAKAGKKGTSTTAVHHVGRRSGTPYVTPVWGERVGDRFLIQLPYGTGVDWCRNILAAGGCTLEQDGVMYDAVAPVIVPAAEARPRLRPAARRMQGIIGAEHYLQLDVRPTDRAGEAPPNPSRDGEDLPNPARVAEGVFKVPGTWISNVYLVETEGGLLLVDTGPGHAKRICRFIEAIGRQPSELRDIVLTHFDADHVGSAAALKARTGARVSIHELDAAVVAKKEPPRQRMLLVVILYKLLSQPVTADRFLSDGDTIGGLRVVHVPGHTAGSIVLVRGDGVVFSGDALITDKDGTILPTDLRLAEDPDLAVQSAERIKALNPRILLPGHGAPCGVSPPDSEVVRTAHWLFSRRGPAFLDRLVQIGDPSLRRIDSYLTVGQTALDMGCGWGHHSLELARKVGPTGMVYAVDLANKCIDSIDRKSHRRGLVNVVARRSTAADVGFIPDATVDLVFANGLLCSMATDRDSAVEEIKRVMKPSGHAYISLGMTPPWGYVDRSEWSRILSGFTLVEGGDFDERWALVSART